MVERGSSAGIDVSELAPQILRPLRKMRGVTTTQMAAAMKISPRAYQDFEHGRTGLLLDRLQQFADILRHDAFALFAAFSLGKPRIALAFADNKLMLIQATTIDGLDDEALDAVAAVDPLTVLDAHAQLYAQLAEHGRAQRRAARGRTPPG